MKPFTYQKHAVQTIETKFNGRTLLAAEPGLGKTFMSLGFLLRNRVRRLPAIVVCPASVKYNWFHEAHDLAGIKSVAVIEGRKFASVPKAELLIINYDILSYWLRRLRRFQPSTVIVDECQYLSNPDSLRSQSFRLLTDNVANILALSGTPFLNRPIELFNILNILCPNDFPSKWEFAKQYTQRRYTRWGWKFDGGKNLERLNKELRISCMVRLRKEDVLDELPPKVRRVIPLPIKSREDYIHASNDFIGWLEENEPNRMKKAQRAEAITKMNYLIQMAAKLKLRYVVDWINSFLEESDEKLVVLGIHRKMLDAIQRRCKVPMVRIDGKVRPHQRTQLVDQFQTEKKTRILLGNLHAAGVGLTLTASWNTAFIQFGWRPGDHIQAEDRTHRIGAVHTVWYWYLAAFDTIEEQLCELIQRKQKYINSVLDGRITKKEDDFNLHDALMKSMLTQNRRKFDGHEIV